MHKSPSPTCHGLRPSPVSDDAAGLGGPWWTPDNHESRALAKMARQYARGRDVLFHGTRYRSLILASGILKFAESGHRVVSFSRSPEVAACCASLPSDDCEASGSILIFDRASLRTQYKLECFADEWERDGQVVDECEERVVERNVEIARHLIGLVAVPTLAQSPKARAQKRACRMRIGRALAECDCGMKWNGCSDCLKDQDLKIIDQFRRTHPDVYKYHLWDWRVRELLHGPLDPINQKRAAGSDASQCQARRHRLLRPSPRRGRPNPGF